MSRPDSSLSRNGLIVVNQSISPGFVKMLSAVGNDFKDCLLITGTPIQDQRHAGIRIAYGAPYGRADITARLVSWLRFALSATPRLAQSSGRALVFVGTNPPFMPIIATHLARLRRQPVVILVWDVYPQHLVTAKLLGASHPLARVWSALNRQAYKQAKAIIVLGEKMAVAVAEDLPTKQFGKVRVIPHWAETDAIRPMPKASNPFAREHGQQGKVTILYSGNIGLSHGLDAFVLAAQHLEHRRDVSFLFVGDGLGAEQLRALADRHSISNVSFAPRQSWDRVPEVLATGDIAIVSQGTGSESLSVPSKTYSSMAAGSAIVAQTSADSDLARLINEAGVGVCVDGGDPAAIASAIEQLLDDSQRLEDLRTKARAVADARFSPRVVWPQIGDTLRSATTRPPQISERLAPSGRLIVLALREALSDAERTELTWLIRGLGSEAARMAARRNKVEAAVGQGLMAHLSEQAIDAEWRIHVGRNARRVSELAVAAAEVGEALESLGIQNALIESAGVLAGSNLAVSSFESGDFDLLIDREPGPAVDEVLADAGFRLADRSERVATSRREYWRPWEGDTSLWLAIGRIPFERAWIRWEAPDRSLKWLARRVQSHRFRGLHTLAPSDALAFVAVHTSLHSYVRSPGIRLQLDVDRLVRAHAIQWPEFMDEVMALGLPSRVFTALAMAEHYMATPIPAHVLRYLAPGAARWAGLRWLLGGEGVLEDGKPKLGRLKTLALDALLHEDGWSSWVAQVARAGLDSTMLARSGATGSRHQKAASVDHIRDWRPA